MSEIVPMNEFFADCIPESICQKYELEQRASEQWSLAEYENNHNETKPCIDF